MDNPRLFRRLVLLAALGLAASAGLVVAQQDDPDQGIAAADSSGSYEVGGVEVDVSGRNAEAARYAGWRLAQRKGWQLLSRRMGGGGAMVSDGTLDAIVSGIVVENEQIGPTRYIARLGVLFSRARAGALLGVAVQATRSAPMLTIPLEYSGGTAVAFEHRTDWADAWGRYRTGNSAVDYVRPAGNGADTMLLNLGQTERPGRGWWRVILDQYGANDILVPVVQLYRQWPGGPVIGVFEARHGPDNHVLTRFTLRVGSSDGVPVLLDAGVKRIDETYQAALRAGQLSGDPGLAYVAPVAAPTPVATPTASVEADTADGAALASAASIVTIQVDTPTASAVTATEAALRTIPGVRSALTTSLAIGGVSVMRVSYDADPAVLRAALESRGWSVVGSGATLRIRRAGQPSQGGQPPAPADNATG